MGDFMKLLLPLLFATLAFGQDFSFPLLNSEKAILHYEQDENPWGVKRKFCPACQDSGWKSCVYEGPCYTTLIYIQPYYDENGNYQYNNPNTTTCQWWCSKGHYWSEVNGKLSGAIKYEKPYEWKNDIAQDSTLSIFKGDGIILGDTLSIFNKYGFDSTAYELPKKNPFLLYDSSLTKEMFLLNKFQLLFPDGDLKDYFEWRDKNEGKD